MRHKGLLITAGVLTALGSVPASAQTTPLATEAEGQCYWPKGGSKEDRDALQAFLTQGNSLLNESLYVEAAARYRAGLKRCEHPAAHYNLALALLNLDRPIEMRQQLEEAVRFGAEPIGKDRLENAKNYIKLLESQLVRIKVRCDVPGAKVTMDGEELFTPPGEAVRWIRTGRHYVVATKDGYVANEVSRTFDPGARPVYDLKLNTLEELTEYRRRWSQAVPWSFIGAGAALGLAGGALVYEGHKTKQDLESRAQDRCPDGCKPGLSDVATKNAQVARFEKAAVGVFAVGGAALVTGAVLQYLNRPQLVRRSYDVDGDESMKVGLVPLLNTEYQGAMAVVRF